MTRGQRSTGKFLDNVLFAFSLAVALITCRFIRSRRELSSNIFPQMADQLSAVRMYSTIGPYFPVNGRQ